MSSLRDVVPLGSTATGVVVAVLLGVFVPGPRIIEVPIFGIAIVLIGLSFMVWSVRRFLRSHTDLRPGGFPSMLVTDGLYRYTRNPIYVGNMLILLGVCILIGTAWPFIVLPAYFLIVNGFIVPFEERRLTKTFGDDYVHYKKRVRRWI